MGYIDFCPDSSGTGSEQLKNIFKPVRPEGDITGVTWWSRTMDIPVLKKGQKVF